MPVTMTTAASCQLIPACFSLARGAGPIAHSAGQGEAFVVSVKMSNKRI